MTRTNISVLFAFVSCAAIVFGITASVAVRQVTDHNLVAVREVLGAAAENAPPESRADYNKVQVKLERQVALSQVRKDWSNSGKAALWIGIFAGIASAVVFCTTRIGREATGS